MIEKIDANQLRDILEKSAGQQPESPKIPVSNQADASLQVNYASLIESARQIPENDAAAVQRAQELLSSGRLESPKNIRAAAKHIITYGI
ncbi:MAG: hypothetical protein KAY65_01165 [Planctomycetes bacterium]|nr:hypothetical protein [Planctomycetota bacterium]